MTTQRGVVAIALEATVEQRRETDNVLPVVAVVDAQQKTAVIWWVDTAGSPGLSRLCGAWVLPEATAAALEPLLWRRHVMTTTSGDALLRDLGAAPINLVDPAATRAGVTEECLRLQRAHEAHLLTLPLARRDVTPPAWPTVPSPLDPARHRADDEDLVAIALETSHWLTSLCAAWKEIEAERLKRRHLRPLGTSTTRDLPLAMTSHHLAGVTS